MQDFIQLMITSMKLKGFAKNTQKTYLGHIRCFAEFCTNYPASAGYDDIRAFLYNIPRDEGGTGDTTGLCVTSGSH